MQFYLRKWLKEPQLDCNPDVWSFRDLVDWQYYIDRLGKTIQKIVTIPAGLQGIDNPCPQVDHPIWLQRNMNESLSSMKQTKIKSHFAVVPAAGSRSQGTSAVFASAHGTPRKTLSDGIGPSSMSKRKNALVDMEDIGGWHKLL